MIAIRKSYSVNSIKMFPNQFLRKDHKIYSHNS